MLRLAGSDTMAETCMYVYVYICVCVCVCIYIYIYIYIYMHACSFSWCDWDLTVWEFAHYNKCVYTCIYPPKLIPHVLVWVFTRYIYIHNNMFIYMYHDNMYIHVSLMLTSLRYLYECSHVIHTYIHTERERIIFITHRKQDYIHTYIHNVFMSKCWP